VFGLTLSAVLEKDKSELHAKLQQADREHRIATQKETDLTKKVSQSCYILCGLVSLISKVSDLRSTCRTFESQSSRCQATTLISTAVMQFL